MKNRMLAKGLEIKLLTFVSEGDIVREGCALARERSGFRLYDWPETNRARRLAFAHLRTNLLRYKQTS